MFCQDLWLLQTAQNEISFSDQPVFGSQGDTAALVEMVLHKPMRRKQGSTSRLAYCIRTIIDVTRIQRVQMNCNVHPMLEWHLQCAVSFVFENI